MENQINVTLSERDLSKSLEAIEKEKIFNISDARELAKVSHWDQANCDYFMWFFGRSFMGTLNNMLMGAYGRFRMPFIGGGAVGGRKQKKYFEKWGQIMDGCSIDEQYKDVADEFISWLGDAMAIQYAQGLIPWRVLKNSKALIELIKGYIDISLENEGMLTKQIVNSIETKNKEIFKDEENKKDYKEKIIPEGFDVVKDRETISPL